MVDLFGEAGRTLGLLLAVHL
eukprot:SAG11_NODE_14482_length_610_cov_1.420744_2_plen_20_part_01